MASMEVSHLGRSMDQVDEQVSKSIERGMVIFRAIFSVDDPKVGPNPFVVVEPEYWCAYRSLVQVSHFHRHSTAWIKVWYMAT